MKLLLIIFIVLFSFLVAAKNREIKCSAIKIEKPPYKRSFVYGGKWSSEYYDLNNTYKFYNNKCNQSYYVDKCNDYKTEKECYKEFKKELLNKNTTCTVKKGSCEITVVEKIWKKGEKTVLIIAMILPMSLFLFFLFFVFLSRDKNYDSIN